MDQYIVGIEILSRTPKEQMMLSSFTLLLHQTPCMPFVHTETYNAVMPLKKPFACSA